MRQKESLMVRTKMMALFAGGALLAFSSVATAQHWGREHTPRDGVCFYEDAEFGGDYFCVRSGDDLGHVPSDMNDRISSIRIFGNAEVTVYRDVRFEGRSQRFRHDIRNLKREGWNDLISSLEVRGSSSRGSESHGSSGGYHGNPDQIVRRAYQDILGREPDSAGLRMYRSRIIDDGWTEAQVRDALRKSPEYREKSTMTRPRATEIVRQAYLSVLKREPDAGSRGYVDKVLHDKWTQQDVERELRKSPEYRNRH
jgi:hypothetical protein